MLPATLGRVALELREAGGARERMQHLLQYARDLPRLSASERTMANRVMGCTAQVFSPLLQAAPVWRVGMDFCLV